MVVVLQVIYTPEYPDQLPELSVEAIEGELSDEETDLLIKGMQTTGEESLGMAMVFTLTSWLKEGLTHVLEERSRKLKEAEDKKFAEYEEASGPFLFRHGCVMDTRINLSRECFVSYTHTQAEKAKTRGTPVTPESFLALQKRLAQRAKEKRIKREEEKVKSLTGKDREEYKKIAARPTGRQLFETGKTSAQADLEYADDDDEQENAFSYDRYSRDERDRLAAEIDKAKEQSAPSAVLYDSD